MKYKDFLQEQELNELFDKAPDIDREWWGAGSDNATVNLVGTESSIIMKFTKYGTKSYKADFQTKDKGKASAMDFFMAALSTIGEFIKKKKPDEMAFYAFDKRRAKIYKRLLGKFIDLSKWDHIEVTGLPYTRDVPALFIKKKSKKQFEIQTYPEDETTAKWKIKWGYT